MRPVMILYKDQPAIVTQINESDATVNLNVFTNHGLILEHHADISGCPTLVLTVPLVEGEPGEPAPDGEAEANGEVEPVAQSAKRQRKQK